MKNSKNKIVMCISVVSLLIGCSLKTDAQKVEFGLRFMPTISSFEMKTSAGGTIKGEATFGYGFGAFLSFNFTNHIGIQGEIIYTSISQKYKELDVERKVKLNYVNVPLLLSFNTGKSRMVNLNVVAGPQIGLNAGSSVHTSGGDGTYNTQAVLSVKKSDIGLAYGAGVDFGLIPTGTFRVGAGFRGVFGLIDISDNSKTASSDSFYILERTHLKTYSGYIGVSFLF